ncbi:hypothetical protein LRR81_18935 [Metabacillus sp. GX 13764]|nr:hypothetical protein [Metabacillus kandeliae]MCD7036324.1 hypothetical protein [Metabacillus kandeliae]
MENGSRLKKLEAFADKYRKLGIQIEVVKSRMELSKELEYLQTVHAKSS